MSSGLVRGFKPPNIPTISKPGNGSKITDTRRGLNVPKIVLPDDDGAGERDANETPPLTPASDGSADDPSIEENTVEEISPPPARFIQAGDIGDDDTPDSDTTESEEEVIPGIRNRRINNKVFVASVAYWSTSILFCLLAYSVYSYLEVAINMERPTRDRVFSMVPREKWAGPNSILISDSWTSFTADNVIVTHTETSTCDSLDNCIDVLKKIKGGAWQYNFLVASNGNIYEALGWQEPSPLYPETPTMVVAFIGNYEKKAPTVAQLTQFQSLLDESRHLKYLSESYSIYGRQSRTLPKKLYSYIAMFRKWGKEQFHIDEDDSHKAQQLNLFFEF